jgi:hypothetical protein
VQSLLPHGAPFGGEFVELNPELGGDVCERSRELHEGRNLRRRPGGLHRGLHACEQTRHRRQAREADLSPMYHEVLIRGMGGTLDTRF